MSFYHDQPLLSPETFQELIRERTAQRSRIVQERRQDGLRQIAEMKSRNGVSPLELFPKEIWLEIMKTLDPKDLWNVYHIHPVFADLIDSNWNRVQDILLPQALNLVLDYMKNMETKGWDMEWNDGTGWWNPPTLSIPFVQLRKVSKNVRQTVDRWFDEKIFQELHQRPEDMTTDWKAVPRMIFYGLSGMEKWVLKWYVNDPEDDDDATRPRNKRKRKTFFYKSIQVEISLNGRNETDPDNFIAEDDAAQDLRGRTFLPFKSALIKFLELVGDQILYFTLYVHPVKYLQVAGIPITDYYLMLQECCVLMPNLVRLEVNFDLGDGYVDDEDYEMPDPQTLIELIEAHPFPTLGKLEKITLEQKEQISVAAKIHDAILGANPHVTMLELKIEDEILALSQDALNRLSLKHFSWENYAWSPCASPGQNDLVCRNWPLTTLELWPKSQSLNSVFKLLEEFPTLENVMLCMVNVEIGSGVQFLNLPNLTYFHCKFNGKFDYDKDDVNFFFSLQFLIHAKKLKKLRWFFNSGWRNENQEIIQPLQKFLEKHECPDKMVDFRGGWKDLNTSNVWKTFPELEIVDLEFRKGYNTYDSSYGSDCLGARRFYRPS